MIWQDLLRQVFENKLRGIQSFVCVAVPCYSTTCTNSHSLTSVIRSWSRSISPHRPCVSFASTSSPFNSPSAVNTGEAFGVIDRPRLSLPDPRGLQDLDLSTDSISDARVEFPFAGGVRCSERLGKDVKD